MEAGIRNSKLLAQLRGAMADFSETPVRDAIATLLTRDTVVRMCHPFGDLDGADWYDTCYGPLLSAIPDLERRDWIVMEGTDGDGVQWVGCGGTYVGTFAAPFLDIPPTGQFCHMRFHEFYRIEDARVTEVQAIWDIPELMMQADAWPLAPSLGREGLVPGPSSQDGILRGPRDEASSAATCGLIIDMLAHMTRHPSLGGPEVMEMDRFWHERMTWYGPAGIGTCRGISGFRNWHQIPFLNAMPDRGQHDDEVTFHFFADGDYAAVTGWPNMKQALTGGGWLGLPATGQTITLRSLDFWRVESSKIRENWVLVDLLDVCAQLGLDVFARLREMNKSRVPGAIPFPVGDR